jgi:hypothetical protein
MLRRTFAIGETPVDYLIDPTPLSAVRVSSCCGEYTHAIHQFQA